jgi:thioredoxin 1
MTTRSTAWRVAIVVALASVVTYVVASKPGRGAGALAPSPMVSHGSAAVAGGIPRLVDLGADKCIPCKAMAPILVELRAEYAGRMQVDFIDVWKDPSAGDSYNIYAIPTQIFFGADGKELTRHEGFNSKADILATWKKFGYDFTSPGPSAPQS